MVLGMQAWGHVRWVDYARRSMQRIGFLKWVLGLSSRAQTLEALTRIFATSVTRNVPVPPGQLSNFHKYVQEQHLYKQRYVGEVTAAQLQDLYLADSALPSHSGAIT